MTMLNLLNIASRAYLLHANSLVKVKADHILKYDVTVEAKWKDYDVS